MSSDDRWISTVLKSGTTSDRVAAMTIRVQEGPTTSISSLQALVTLASKKVSWRLHAAQSLLPKAREARALQCVTRGTAWWPARRGATATGAPWRVMR